MGLTADLLAWRNRARRAWGRVWPRRVPLARLADLPPARPGPAGGGLGLAIIFKDEAPYLAEWIEFHRMLGVAEFHAYDNGSTDGSAAVWAPYVAAGIARLTPWPRFSTVLPAQATAYAHAIALTAGRLRWLGCLDVDEFLMPVEGASLPETLAGFGDQPAISLPWINFGSGGHRVRPEGLVIEAYTERAALPHRGDQAALLRHKTLVDPGRVARVGVHACGMRGDPERMWNDRGEAFDRLDDRDPRHATTDRLRLHHYFTRSEAELAEKLRKGRVSRGGVVDMGALDRRLAQYGRAVERDTFALRFAAGVRARLAGGDDVAA